MMAAGMTSLSWHQVDFQTPVGETAVRHRHLLPQLAGPVVNRPATSTGHSSCYCYSCAGRMKYLAVRRSLSVVMAAGVVVDRMMSSPVLAGHSVLQLLVEQVVTPTAVTRHCSVEFEWVLSMHLDQTAGLGHTG